MRPLTSSDIAGAATPLRTVLLPMLLGYREYRVVYSRAVLATSVLPRALLQVCFLALVGATVSGADGRLSGFLGGVVFVAVVPLLVQAPDVIVDEKAQRTLHHLRLGRPPILAVMLMRSWIHLVQGLTVSLLAVVALGPLFVGGQATVRALTVWPVLLASSVSGLGLGMCVGAASLGKRGDVLLANAAQYLVMLCCMLTVPSANPLLEAARRVIPGTHTVEVLRAGTWHDAAGAILAELAVGVFWLLVAQAVLSHQSYRARRLGFDDFQ